MFKTVLTALKKQRDDRRRYRQAISEIESLTQRELADLRADPVEMAQQAWRSIYGTRA